MAQKLFTKGISVVLMLALLSGITPVNMSAEIDDTSLESEDFELLSSSFCEPYVPDFDERFDEDLEELFNERYGDWLADLLVDFSEMMEMMQDFSYEPEPAIESETEREPEPEAEPEPKTETELETETEPTIEPTIEPMTEPESEQELKSEVFHESEKSEEPEVEFSGEFDNETEESEQSEDPIQPVDLPDEPSDSESFPQENILMAEETIESFNSNVIEIFTPADLEKIGGSGSAGKTYILRNNINLSGTTWPIVEFFGTFDGSNFTISGLSIPSGSNRDDAGLFARLGSGSSVRNLNIVSTGINGRESAGTLAGVAATGVTITNVSSSGGTVNGKFAGGLIGISLGTISNSKAASTVNGSLDAGGLAGMAGGQIINSSASGDVTIPSSAVSDVSAGGLVGNSFSIIRQSFATGAVRATSSGQYSAYAGGLVGNSFGLIEDSNATAGIVAATSGGSGNAFAGGLTGKGSNDFIRCRAARNVTATCNGTGNAYAGGLTSVSEYRIVNSSASGNATASTAVTTGGAVITGGLTGSSRGVIINSHATGAVTGTSGGNNAKFTSLAGGLAGESNSEVRDSYATGNVTLTARLTPGNTTAVAGGLIGIQNDAAVVNSFASGRVQAESTSGSAGGGGLVGGFNAVDAKGGATVSGSRATGDVIVVSASTNNLWAYAGGIIGSGRKNTIINSHATGNMTTTGAISCAGGLIGFDRDLFTIRNSSAKGNITANGSTTYAGGLIGWFEGTEISHQVRVINSFRYNIQRFTRNGNTQIGPTNTLGELKQDSFIRNIGALDANLSHVLVIDELIGEAVLGASVRVGGTTKTTNSTGLVSFTQAEAHLLRQNITITAIGYRTFTSEIRPELGKLSLITLGRPTTSPYINSVLLNSPFTDLLRSTAIYPENSNTQINLRVWGIASSGTISRYEIIQGNEIIATATGNGLFNNLNINRFKRTDTNNNIIMIRAVTSTGASTMERLNLVIESPKNLQNPTTGLFLNIQNHFFNGDNMTAVVNIQNLGTVNSTGVTLNIRRAASNGQIITSNNLGNILPGTVTTVLVNIDMTTVNFAANESRTLHFVLGANEPSHITTRSSDFISVPQRVYMINLSSVNGGTVSGAGAYAHGTGVTVSTRNEGFHFSGWYEYDRKLEGVGEAYTFTALSDRHLEARYTALKPPGTPTVTSNGPVSALIKWTAADDGATEYRIYRRLGGTPEFIRIGSVDSETREFIDKNVRPLTRYEYKIIAVWGTGFGAITHSSPIRVFYSPQLPTPANLRATSIRPTEVDLTWTRMPSAIGYEIHFSGRSGTDIPNLNPGALNITTGGAANTPMTRTFSGLNPNTSYFTLIRAYWYIGNERLYGNYSNAVNFRTTGPAPVWSTPSSSNISATGATLHFSRIVSAAGYQLFKDGVPDAYIQQPPGDGSVVNAPVTGLTPGLASRFTVQAKWLVDDVQRPGNMSSAITVTPFGAAPGGLAASRPNSTTSSITPTGFTISWNPIAPGVDGVNLRGLTGYRVFLNGRPVVGLIRETTNNRNGERIFFYDFEGLTPNTSYLVQVAGVWNGTAVGRPASLTVRTSAPAPTGLAIHEAATGTNVKLRWDAAHTDLKVDGYRLSKTVDGVTKSVDLSGAVLNNLRDSSNRFIYTDYDLRPGVQVRFAVQSLWNSRPSSNSDVGTRIPGTAATVTVNPPGIAPRISSVLHSPTQVTVTWEPIIGGNVESYNVYIGNHSVNVKGPRLEAVFSNLEPNKIYPLRIAAVWDAGTEPQTRPKWSPDGEWIRYREGRLTSVVNVRTTAPAPSGFAINRPATGTDVQFRWNAAPVNLNVAGYRISKTVDGVTTYVDLHGDGLNGLRDKSNQNIFIYTDKDLRPGKQARFTLQSLWRVGSELKPGAAAALTVNPPGNAPGGVRAIADRDDPTKITVTWSAVAGVSHYRVDIRHRDNGKVIETVDIAVAAVRVHTFSNLIPATRYQVSVTGIWGGEHQGRPGRLVNVNTSGPAPTRLALTGRPTNTTVTFTWQQPVTSLMIAGYEVRKENANNPTTGSWIPISPEDSNNRRWTDVNLNPGVAVRYRVRALLRVNGEVHPGNPSPVLSVTPPGGRAPGGVRARVNSPTELTVTWNFMPEVHSYNVFLLPHQGITPIEHRPDIPGGATRRVQFTNLDPDTRYRVRVEGVWNVSTSDEEDLRPGRAATVSVRTTGPAPRNLRAVSLNNDSLRLTWNPVHDPNVTCYRITRTIGNDMTTAKVYEIPVAKFFSNGNSFVDEKLSPGDRFRYTVQAQWPVEVASGENLYATVIPGAAARVNATIQGPAPGSVRVTRHGPTNLTVFWSAVRGTGLLGYNVYIRDVNDEDTAAIKPVRVPVTTPASHQFINLNPNTVYQIWVKSVWATQTGELESMHSSRIITTRRW